VGAARDHEARVLVSAASRCGATTEIARASGEALAQRGFETTVAAPDEVGTIEENDVIVLGRALYTGH
jgi:menaquinone-dependent protoporphyrinogen oxidase